jgi:hypothetical protein
MERGAVGRDFAKQVFHCFQSLPPFRDEGREQGDRWGAGGSSRNIPMIELSDMYAIVKMMGDFAA